MTATVRKIFLLIFIGLSIINAKTAYGSDRITPLLLQDIKKYNIPGIVISISYPDKITYTYKAGYSNLQNRTSMNQSQLFPIGSITKSFVAVLALQLQEQGKLKLSDTLYKLSRPGSNLSSVLLHYPSLKNITLTQLLTHTSGLPDALNADIFQKDFAKNPTKRWNDTELLELAMKQKVFFRPGEKNKYYYSNTDYLLAGIAIESVTKKRLVTLLYHLFQQAQLKNIYYPPSGVADTPQVIIKQLAHGYIDDNMNWPNMAIFREYPAVIIPGIRPLKGYDVTSLGLIANPLIPASGAIITNTKTMTDWYRTLFNNKLITPASLSLMLTGVPTGSSGKYGLGITIRHSSKFNTTIISHNGSQLGYQTNLIYLKNKGIIIAAAINSDGDAISDPEKGILADVIAIESEPIQILSRPCNTGNH